MRIAFIETNAITNEVLRAYADAHPLCVGYPDGVPETWRTVSAAQQEGGKVPDSPMKHFTDETRGGAGITVERFDEARAALRIRPDSPLCAIEGVGLVREDDLDGLKLIRRGEAVGGIATVREEDLDPAALLGPAAEPVDWPEWQREALRKILAEDDYPLGGIPSDDEDSAGDWPERDAAGDEEC